MDRIAVTDEMVEAAKTELLNHSGLVTAKTVRSALIAAMQARTQATVGLSNVQSWDKPKLVAINGGNKGNI